MKKKVSIKMCETDSTDPQNKKTHRRDREMEI